MSSTGLGEENPVDGRCAPGRPFLQSAFQASHEARLVEVPPIHSKYLPPGPGDNDPALWTWTVSCPSCGSCWDSTDWRELVLAMVRHQGYSATREQISDALERKGRRAII